MSENATDTSLNSAFAHQLLKRIITVGKIWDSVRECCSTYRQIRHYDHPTFVFTASFCIVRRLNLVISRWLSPRGDYAWRLTVIGCATKSI
jgi:hypothetical protein